MIGMYYQFMFGNLLERLKSITNRQGYEGEGIGDGNYNAKNSLVFTTNHDRQRSHPANNTHFKSGSTNLALASGVLMGWRYGVKRIMSSYDFVNTNSGPPTLSTPEEWFNATILPPTTAAGASDPGTVKLHYKPTSGTER